MSKIWEVFISNCKQRYCPGENITIDEQLLAFRGRCGFRMYVANNPAKYGLKIMMVCHRKNNYMLNAIPYLEKTKPPDAVVLGHYITMELCKPYFCRKRGITGDNCFTSESLGLRLCLKKDLTYVDNIRKNKREIPDEMTDKTGFLNRQCEFVFDDNITLLTSVAQKVIRKACCSLFIYVTSCYS